MPNSSSAIWNLLEFFFFPPNMSDPWLVEPEDVNYRYGVGPPTQASMPGLRFP